MKTKRIALCAVLTALALGLSARYGLDREEHFRYIDRIIGRFENPYLDDRVERVGREPLRKLGHLWPQTDVLQY